MNKKILIGVVVVALIAVGFFMRSPAERVVTTVLGSSADIISPYLRWGNVEHYAANVTIRTATTTPCAIQSPSATSTLTMTALSIKTATSTATTWTASKASTAFATTTLLGTFSLGSGAQGTMVFASSTETAVIDDISVFGPNEYVVWGVAGTAISGTANLNGVCQAEWTVVGR